MKTKTKKKRPVGWWVAVFLLTIVCFFFLIPMIASEFIIEVKKEKRSAGTIWLPKQFSKGSFIDTSKIDKTITDGYYENLDPLRDMKSDLNKKSLEDYIKLSVSGEFESEKVSFEYKSKDRNGAEISPILYIHYQGRDPIGRIYYADKKIRLRWLDASKSRLVRIDLVNSRELEVTGYPAKDIFEFWKIIFYSIKDIYKK